MSVCVLVRQVKFEHAFFIVALVFSLTAILNRCDSSIAASLFEQFIVLK
jgi:hypothetical protein